MIVKTLFQHEGRFALGEVEVQLLPGVPLLHVVGQPDPHIKECGLKIKSALRSCDLNWPQGHQIVVNLRPSYFRKSSSGADLAIALGFLALTGQLNENVVRRIEDCVVYGEVALNGKIFAPPDLPSAIRASKLPVLTGQAGERIRDGQWLELPKLNSAEAIEVRRRFDWDGFWTPPTVEEIDFPPEAAKALILASIAKLNVLVAGPQGSGKSTWAKTLYALSARPEPEKMSELEDMFGEEALARRWRPFECPHHSITTQAMIGGGAPVFPGVISRSHGGILVMDEFLEYNTQVLEALREPVESGYIVHARRGERVQIPASFQLIATSNLCKCGRLDPAPNKTFGGDCRYGLNYCSSILRRLSGPVMDRFDLLLLSNGWLRICDRVTTEKIRETIDCARRFQISRGETKEDVPEWFGTFGYSHRRRNSLLRVARALADLRESPAVEDSDFLQASHLVVDPMDDLRRFFA